MEYGICTALTNYQLLEEMGYDYIELSVTATAALEEGIREEYRKKLEASSLKCRAFNILFPKTMDLIGGGTKTEEIREYLHQSMAMVKSFGAGTVVFGSGKCRKCPETMAYGDAYKRLVEVCRMTGEIAGEYGIQIVIEPLSRRETNLICTMAEGAILEADVALPNVGLLSDYFHVMANHDQIEDIKTIKNFRHIHIASADGRRFPLAENAGEAYREFFQALKAVGYDGGISIEGKTEDLARDGVKALELLKKLEREIDG